MSTREELDAMLLKYLQREEDDPIRKRLEHHANWQMEHDRKDEERHVTVVRALDGHNFRLQSLEQKATKLEGEVEDTGEHRVADLQRQLSDARGSLEKRDETRRNFWLGVVTAIVGGVSVAMILAHFGIHP